MDDQKRKEEILKVLLELYEKQENDSIEIKKLEDELKEIISKQQT